MGRHSTGDTPRGRRMLLLTIAVLTVLTLAGIALAGGFSGSDRSGDSARSPASGTATSAASPSENPSTAPSKDTDCTEVRVAADPAEEPWVAALAAAYTKAHHTVDGRCVQATVTGVAAGGLPGALTGPETARPDAWLASSLAAVATARSDTQLADPLSAAGTSIASSPLVVGVPTEVGDAVAAAAKTTSLIALGLAPAGWGAIGHADWGPVRLSMPDPVRDPDGMSALLAAASGGQDLTVGTLSSDASRRAALGLSRVTRTRTGDAGDLLAKIAGSGSSRDFATRIGLPLVPESSLAAYDRTKHPVSLRAVYPFAGLGALTYPLVPVTGDWVGKAEQAGLADFRGYLLSAPVQARLGGYGLRSAAGELTDGGPGLRVSAVPPKALPVEPAVVATARQEWTALSRPVSALALIDVSGSMSQQVPGAGATKLALATKVATSSLVVFADSDHIGLREFSTDLDGTKPWRELVPLGPAAGAVGGTDRRTASVAAYKGLQPKGGTALYDSIRDAVGAAQRAYTPGALNTVIVLTDGRNEDAPGSITLDQLTSALQSVAQSAHPVHLITIGYGADVDENALSAIAKASGGTSFASPDPRSIDKVFVQALGALGR